ncbi:MAG TPA: apolipoprotein N-acyltransferase, partial [Burkholderiaceae bacterium]|nr:apolipoprotein N-acyltransferase [Burkholderiaceae bacterium]
MSWPARRALSPAAPAALPAWGDVLLVAALGAVQTLAYVYTRWWPLQLLCVALLAQRVFTVSVWRAAVLGLTFGTAWLGAGVWWLFISMHRYGNLPAWLAALAVLVLALALSSYLALAMAAVARWRAGRPWHDALCFSAAWLLAELARTWLFTGFPWLVSGYAHVDSPLAVLAPWVGVVGIGAAAAAIAALWARAASHRVTAAVALAALALAAWAGQPAHSQPGATLSVSLLQTNVPQEEKFVLEQLPTTLRALAADLTTARGRLVIAPETAVPLLPSQLDDVAPGYMATLVAHFASNDRAAIIGVPLGDYDRGYSNSVIGFTGAAAVSTPYRYDKYHLVPFGEFIPTGFRWFTTLLNIPLGDFVRGARNPPSFAFGGER